MKRKPQSMRSKQAFRRAFFQLAGENILAFKQMLDHQPDLCFYLKDAQGRIVALNRRNCEICNFADELDAVGLTSDQLFPAVKAKTYIDQDRQVLASGQPLVNVTNRHPADDSANFTQNCIYPVRSVDGSIVGTMCIYRLVRNPDIVPSWHGTLKNVTRHIADHYMEPLTLAGLARLANISESSLQRMFSRTFGITPSRYVNVIRLTAARQLLETTQKPLTEIALETGFYDHSHFAKAFRADRGISPGEYRRRHRKIS